MKTDLQLHIEAQQQEKQQEQIRLRQDEMIREASVYKILSEVLPILIGETVNDRQSEKDSVIVTDENFPVIARACYPARHRQDREDFFTFIHFHVKNRKGGFREITIRSQFRNGQEAETRISLSNGTVLTDVDFSDDKQKSNFIIKLSKWINNE